MYYNTISNKPRQTLQLQVVWTIGLVRRLSYDWVGLEKREAKRKKSFSSPLPNLSTFSRRKIKRGKVFWKFDLSSLVETKYLFI